MNYKFLYPTAPPKIPEPECRVDPDCPTNKACIRNECVNPCYTTTCGVNAECRVNNHRAVCICVPGYEGDPYEICEERKHNYSLKCTIALNIWSFCYLAGCKSDQECPQHLACIRRECQDPCIYERCGQNAECSVRNHRAKCECLPGYRGNPYDRCRQYECLTDPECPTTKACRNEKCVDPCDCAENAHCTPRNHRGICACDSGYTGDPYGVRCNPSKKNVLLASYIFCMSNILSVPEPDLGCSEDAECPSRQACIIKNGRGECVNPCLEFRPCATDAKCEVKNELPLRVMTCTCNPGFTGKGDERCDKIGKHGIHKHEEMMHVVFSSCAH